MLLNYLNQITDKRKSKGKQYHLGYILFFSILAILSGATSYPKIEAFIDEKFSILDEIFNMGWIKPPDESTIRKIFQKIDGQDIEKTLRKYCQEVAKLDKATLSNVIAIDGKRLRGSFDNFSDQKALHMLNAFTINENLIIAEIEIDQKSNEIPAVQQFIKESGLEGCIFTMDAMHCQKKLLA